MAVSKPTHIGPQDKVVFVDNYGVKRIQRIGYTPNFNNVEIGEVGALGIIESIPELITTSVNMDTNDWGSTDTMALLMGEKAVTPYVSGVVNSYILTENDFTNAIVDFAINVRETDTLRRTQWLPNQYLVGFDLTYNVDGVASENYTFAGDADYDFVGKYADLRILRGAYLTASSFTVTGIYQTNFTGYAITANNQIVSTASQMTLGPLGATNQTIITGTNLSTLASGTRIRALLYKVTPATFLQRQSDGGVNSPGYAAVMGRQVYIYLGDSTVTTGSTDKFLRLQSVNISADLGREDLKELGNDLLVGKVLNIPIRINLTAEALDADLESYAKVVGGATLTSWNNYQNSPTTTGVVFTSSLLSSTGRKLIVNVYKERSSPTTLLKQITMTGLYVSGKSGELAVNGRGSLTWSMQGSYITVSGTGNNPLS